MVDHTKADYHENITQDELDSILSELPIPQSKPLLKHEKGYYLFPGRMHGLIRATSVEELESVLFGYVDYDTSDIKFTRHRFKKGCWNGEVTHGTNANEEFSYMLHLIQDIWDILAVEWIAIPNKIFPAYSWNGKNWGLVVAPRIGLPEKYIIFELEQEQSAVSVW